MSLGLLNLRTLLILMIAKLKILFIESVLRPTWNKFGSILDWVGLLMSHTNSVEVILAQNS